MQSNFWSDSKNLKVNKFEPAQNFLRPVKGKGIKNLYRLFFLRNTYFDINLPVGTPFLLEARVGVCGVILFPEGFFHVQIL